MTSISYFLLFCCLQSICWLFLNNEDNIRALPYCLLLSFQLTSACVAHVILTRVFINLMINNAWISCSINFEKNLGTKYWKKHQLRMVVVWWQYDKDYHYPAQSPKHSPFYKGSHNSSVVPQLGQNPNFYPKNICMAPISPFSRYGAGAGRITYCRS